MLAELPQEDVRLVLSCGESGRECPRFAPLLKYQPQAPWCRRQSGAFRERASSWTSAPGKHCQTRRDGSPVAVAAGIRVTASHCEAASMRRRRRFAPWTLSKRCEAALKRATAMATAGFA